ncbi:IPTL-CTERM sorting domain-containing protein [Comamonas sp. SCN 65-56]|uniref:IPTL-CTERM sorting domain-containing protein n=1 Tax=Comamonas sp. SCN 65-56 TaxID=1660095 RepID=UPI0025C3D998|nr:IPTL-CTERM sorting domain-containing protein [Comamonas sp. SCN 65-56]
MNKFVLCLAHGVIAIAGLWVAAGATAAPFATTYGGVIAHSGLPFDAPDGAAFTLTLVLDNGGASAGSQSWSMADLRCGFWRWRVDAARRVAVALDLSGGIAQGAGVATTNAAGTLTGLFSAVHTNGAMAWADFDVAGLAAGSAIGWAADGAPQVFGVMAGGGGGSFDDGSGTPAGGVQMLPGRWSAPLPFTGACDASAVPPSPPVPPAPHTIPTLSGWAMVLLCAALGLMARRTLRQRA